MTDLLRVEVGDGKYTVVLPEDCRLYALRYGERWREGIVDRLILTLAQEVESLREDKTLLVAACKVAVDALGCDRVRKDRLVAQEIIHKAAKRAEEKR